VDYIHLNPVKHGLAQRPVDWPWSSLHRYIRQGIVPPNWAVGVDEGQFGE
jgi:putative transposase